MSEGRTRCSCPNDDGIECEPDQVALCVQERSGRCRRRCASKPTAFITWSPSAQLNWAIEIITDLRRSPNQPITDEDLALLARGEYVDDERGLRVHFQLPDDLERGLGRGVAMI
jgi:hypothetical protein